MLSQDNQSARIFSRIALIYRVIRRYCYRKFHHTSRKSRILGIVALFLTVFALGSAGFAPPHLDMSDAPVRQISKDIALPHIYQQIAALTNDREVYTNEINIRHGDTLASMLMQLGVNDNDIANFIKSNTVARTILQLRVGQRLTAQVSANGELQQLQTLLNNHQDPGVKNLILTRHGDTFKTIELPAKLERHIEMRSGDIRSSLFAATDQARIPDHIARQIVDMFATRIDFAADLRRGDRFSVIYETFWSQGALIRTGRVLAAEFTNAGTVYQAVWFDEPTSPNSGAYYTFDGKSLKKAFLKSPLAFTRISSGFALRRHPIFGQWKQHKGIDFAAPTGTPIRVTGDGIVSFIGRQNGYGNVIIIKHWGRYATVYGHMSRFAAGLRRGMKVGQGTVIGYVGMTGWATGPHLHYEFRINDVPHNPLAVEIPNAQLLAGAKLQRFRLSTTDMQRRLAMLRAPDDQIRVAYQESGQKKK